MPPSSTEVVLALENFGLSSTETKIYLELMNLGQTTAGPLVRRCNLHRQFVYSALEKLEQRGLVSHVIRKARKNFFTTRPELLLQQETERYRQIQSIIPELLALGKKGDEQIQVQVFFGVEEYYNNLLTVIDSAARNDRIIRVVGGAADNYPYNLIGSRYAEYVAYAKRKKVGKHFIASDPPGPEHRERFMKEQRNQYRYLQGGLSSPSHSRITPELVTMEIFGKDVITVQIWNKTVAKSYLENFQALWKIALPPKAALEEKVKRKSKKK